MVHTRNSAADRCRATQLRTIDRRSLHVLVRLAHAVQRDVATRRVDRNGDGRAQRSATDARWCHRGGRYVAGVLHASSRIGAPNDLGRTEPVGLDRPGGRFLRRVDAAHQLRRPSPHPSPPPHPHQRRRRSRRPERKRHPPRHRCPHPAWSGAVPDRADARRDPRWNASPAPGASLPTC